MNKFKKLSRAEMKQITGAGALCQPTDYVTCQCDYGAYTCQLVGPWAPDGPCCPATRNQVCHYYCGGSETGLNQTCWTDFGCSIADNTPTQPC